MHCLYTNINKIRFYQLFLFTKIVRFYVTHTTLSVNRLGYPLRRAIKFHPRLHLDWAPWQIQLNWPFAGLIMYSVFWGLELQATASHIWPSVATEWLNDRFFITCVWDIFPLGSFSFDSIGETLVTTVCYSYLTHRSWMMRQDIQTTKQHVFAHTLNHEIDFSLFANLFCGS